MQTTVGIPFKGKLGGKNYLPIIAKSNQSSGFSPDKNSSLKKEKTCLSILPGESHSRVFYRKKS